MVREFGYKGETFRVTAHGIHGHEEIFIVHILDGEEGGETSVDRMTEENDTSAPLEAKQGIECQDPSAGFAWREGKIVFDVHDGLQDHVSE